MQRGDIRGEGTLKRVQVDRDGNGIESGDTEGKRVVTDRALCKRRNN